MKSLWICLCTLLVCLTTAAQEPLFSGQTQLYEDAYNGYKIKIPSEFQNTGKGANTFWTGPNVDNFATTITVNAQPMPGIHPQAIYDGVIRSKKSDRNVTAVVAIKMPGKLKGKPIFAFRCKESDHQPGSADSKLPNDHHRWYLHVYGNEYSYEVCVTGSFQALGLGKELPPVYEAVLSSFSLIKN